ncbi:MAG: branched-chain amino acid ABC transporter permease [Pseudomonadota bacterium]
MLADLAQNTIDGLTFGAAYALLALGFTLIFGVLRRVNLSYGPAIMFGCYGATWVSLAFHSNLLLLLIVTVAATVLAGAYVERLCFAPHRGGSGIAAMVASFALWMQFEELATVLLPRHLYPFPALYGGGPLALGPLSMRVEALAMLLAAALVCALLWWTLYRTRFGLAVRAVVDQPVAAQLAGIGAGRVFVLVFALASAIGGLAGYLIAASQEQVTPMLGMWSTLKGLVAMMLGGLGSLPGAVAGGLVLGVIEAHSQWFFGPQMRDLLAYLLLFVLLALNPAWMSAWKTTRSAS